MKRLLIYAIGYAIFAFLATASLLSDHTAPVSGPAAPAVSAAK